MTRAAIYIRVSTEKQVDEGYSLQFQEEKCMKKIEYEEWELVNIYRDEGISGKLDKTSRPGLNQMLEDAKVGLFDTLVFYSIDRLSRDTANMLNLFNELESYNVKMCCLREKFETDTPTGKFFLTILAATAQLDRDHILEKTEHGREARRKIDGEMGGKLPYGYMRTSNGIEIDKDRAKTVKLMFILRNKYKRSYRQIAEYINENIDEYSKPGSGKRWNQSSIRKIILNNVDKYEGSLRNDSEVNWPKIDIYLPKN